VAALTGAAVLAVSGCGTPGSGGAPTGDPTPTALLERGDAARAAETPSGVCVGGGAAARLWLQAASTSGSSSPARASGWRMRLYRRLLMMAATSPLARSPGRICRVRAARDSSELTGRCG
jgi:hypothetical protein